VYGLSAHKKRSLDALLNPPRRIRAEPDAATGVKAINRPQQPKVALLNQIPQTEPATDIPLGDVNNQSQIASYQTLPGLRVIVIDYQLRQTPLSHKTQQRPVINLLEVFLYACVESYSLTPFGKKYVFIAFAPALLSGRPRCSKKSSIVYIDQILQLV